MTLGPVSYTVIAFPGNRFTGNLSPAVETLVSNGTVRVLDLLFVGKDESGDTVCLEFDQRDELVALGDLDSEVGRLIEEEELAQVAEQLPTGNSALVIVWEDLWAVPFVDAVREAGGVLIDQARIPADRIEAALAELAASLKADSQ